VAHIAAVLLIGWARRVLLYRSGRVRTFAVRAMTLPKCTVLDTDAISIIKSTMFEL